ncbi:polyprenyl synthetase family protein [Agrobacterium sp. S2]|nr:polyprenyl synthetase family protein [Agrobacterium sp. S2]
MGYVEDEVAEIIDAAAGINLSPSQKKEQFLLSSRQGQLVPENSQSFEEKLNANAAASEILLNDILSDIPVYDEVARPSNLMAAMRHGALMGGKRLRPFLIAEITTLLGGNLSAALRIGAALELLHCHSLIHDDLPAMDNDELRRGLPTVHIAFDEATALLAGDALLVMAFDVISSPETSVSDRQKVELTLALSKAAGAGGMIGGQAFDLAAERAIPDEARIATLQAMKTGALIRFACEAGAIVAGASSDERKRFREYGNKIGLAFQLADDLLDITSDAASLGRSEGNDVRRGKGTMVGIRGVRWAEQRLSEITAEAVDLLAPYGAKAETLRNTATAIAFRRS